MSDRTKKIVLGTSLSAVLIALIIVIWLYWPAISSTIKDEKYYTQTDMDKAVDDAYNQALGERDDYIEQIEYYKTELEAALQELTERTNQLQEALSQNTTNSELIEELNQTISSLNTQIDSLQSQIKELQAKLDAFAEYEGVAVYATFYVDGQIYDVDVVNKNTDYVDFPNEIVVDGCNFEGWSLDGKTVIDEENYTISETTNFYAVLTCNIQFKVNGNLTEQTVLKNTVLSTILPTVQDYEGYIFNGFYNGNKEIDDDYKITQSISFTAKFRKYTDLTVRDIDGEFSIISLYGGGIRFIGSYESLGYQELGISSYIKKDGKYCDPFDTDIFYSINGLTLKISAFIATDTNVILDLVLAEGSKVFTEDDIESVKQSIFPIEIRVCDGALTEVIE